MASSNEAFADWTRRDKSILFEAFNNKNYTTAEDLDRIQERIPSKTPEQLKAAIDYLKKHPHFEKEERKEKLGSSPPTATSSQREQVREASSSRSGRSETNTEMAKNFDFKQVYNQITNAVEGKPIVADARTVEVLRTCIDEIALRSQGMTPALKAFRDKLDKCDEERNLAANPATNQDTDEASSQINNPASEPQDNSNIPSAPEWEELDSTPKWDEPD